jgi:serine/threonine protein kinase
MAGRDYCLAGVGAEAAGDLWGHSSMDEVVFGRYRLIEVIGEGGMGKVYKAHDTVIDRHVAVKVLSTELATEPGFRERFRREAHTAARLTEAAHHSHSRHRRS